MEEQHAAAATGAARDRTRSQEHPRLGEQSFRPLGLSRDNAWLTLSTLLYGASVGFYQYVLPLYVASLGASPGQVGLALGVGNTGSVAGILAGGLVVNQFSYRWQIVTSWFVSAIAGALFVVAGSWEVVALAVLLSTLSLYGIPAYNAYIVLARDGQETAEALTLVYVSFTAGSIVTPALGAWIIAGAGVRAMFLASFACILASTLAVLPIRERTPLTEAGPPSSAPASGRPRVAPLHAYRKALANRSLRRLLLVLGGVYVATFVGVSLLPNYLQDRLGAPTSLVSGFGTGAAAVGVVASLALARVVGPLGGRRALALAQALLSAGLALSLLAPRLGPLALPIGGVGFSLRGGVQAQQTLARAMVAAVVDGASLGSAFALLSAVFNVAQTLGPVLAGALYAVDPALPLIVALGVGLPTVAWLALRADPTTER